MRPPPPASSSPAITRTTTPSPSPSTPYPSPTTLIPLSTPPPPPPASPTSSSPSPSPSPSPIPLSRPHVLDYATKISESTGFFLSQTQTHRPPLIPLLADHLPARANALAIVTPPWPRHGVNKNLVDSCPPRPIALPSAVRCCIFVVALAVGAGVGQGCALLHLHSNPYAKG
ncbi:hypothetical protein L1887_17784 [Cichorium endivia]|nr:hypothetical protein L1887_17784 [Cichorium endivia]